MLVSVQQEVVNNDVHDGAPMYGKLHALHTALTWVSNVNLLSMTTPSDLISDDTGWVMSQLTDGEKL